MLPKVKQYHDDLNIPFGHWQLDSWFYPKDGAVNRGGGGGAVVNWTSMDSVFPSGMVAFQNSIGLPMVMHNRQFSATSDYIKHWKDIEWYTTGPRAAIPHNPEIFYRKFFTQQVGWGLSMYEQDWMNVQVSCLLVFFLVFVLFCVLPLLATLGGAILLWCII